MAKTQSSYRHLRFHGDASRFEVVAQYIGSHYQGKVNKIADVAGGQGLLSRILSKKYGFDCEVIDPRGWTLVGVKNRKELYKADMADYYDLIVGLHPDEALLEVVNSALVRPVIVVPCCNFWSREQKLGRDELLRSIDEFLQKNHITSKRVVLDFKGPKNIAIITEPPKHCLRQPRD